MAYLHQRAGYTRVHNPLSGAKDLQRLPGLVAIAYQAPAGAGKTHSLQALRAAAHRAVKEVLVVAPTGKAVDEAMRGQAGDRGLTVAKALALIDDDQLSLDRRTVIVVDEASMVPTPSTSVSTTSSPTPMRRLFAWRAISRSAPATSSSVATTMPP